MKKMLVQKKVLTNKQQKLNENAKICYVCKEKLKINELKLEIIVIMQVNTEVLSIVYLI